MGKDAPEPSALDVDVISRDYLTPNVAAQARFSALLEYPPSKWLLEREMEARGLWPSAVSATEGARLDVYRTAFNSNLKGLCFSGGGIRSATFNLGILQALAARRKLGSFDYLSTVSGGGYIHQFLASWIACENLAKVEEQLSPLPEDSVRTAWPDPIRWLRRYSNYLTPQKGLLTTDTWAAISIWLRNTFLNQIVLISSLLLVLLLPHVPLQSVFNAASQNVNFKTGWFAPSAAIVLLFALAAVDLYRGLNRVATNDGQMRVGFRERDVLFLVVLPVFLALFATSPFVYRSAFQALVARPAAPAQVEQQGIPPLLDALHRLGKKQATAETCCVSIKGCCAADCATGSDAHAWNNFAAWRQRYQLDFWLSNQGDLWQILIAYLIGHALLAAALSAAISKWPDRVFPIPAAMVVAVGTAFGLLYVVRFLLVVVAMTVSFDTLLRITIVFLPLLLLTVLFISMDLAIGTIGVAMEDSAREWIARVRGVSFVSAFVWLAIVGSSLLGPLLVSGLSRLPRGWLNTAIVGWLGTSISSIFAGNSRATSGSEDTPTATSRALSYLVIVGPPVLIAGLMLILAWALQIAVDAYALYTVKPFLEAVGVLAVIVLFFSWRVDINEFSLHAFYRDRIARCYAGASNPDRKPNAFTGLATSDSRLRVADLLPIKFSSGDKALWVDPTKPPCYQGPFPIFCTSLDLSFGEDLAYQERKAAAFAFTPLYCGYDIGWTEGESANVQFNGYVPTKSFAYPDGGPHVSTAVAASGAAVSPNMGFHSSPAMAFLLTIFNVRLGWWIPNPRNLRTDFLSRMSGATPVFGLPYLLQELFGNVSDNSPFVALSDGGHFENMGLYELVRRRCKTIVICDAEEDGDFTFQGIGMAIRKCRIDFGAEIAIPLDRVVPRSPGFSECAFAIGKIHYPGHGENPNAGTIEGDILYLKSTLTGKEPADIRNYHREDDHFPSDSTLNQWFTESQFESYRRLGQFIGETPEVVAWLDRYL
jgi:hypothetical protein